MELTQQVRDMADAQSAGVADDERQSEREAGMRQKAREFRERGGAIYLKVE